MRALFTGVYFSLFFVGSLFATEAPQETYNFIGRHLFAQYYDCNQAALQDHKQLAETMQKATLSSGATILGDIKHDFDPQGFSMIILLSESHASIHTYPEHGACFVDFFSCGSTCKAEKFDEVLRAYLKPKNVSCEILDRE